MMPTFERQKTQKHRNQITNLLNQDNTQYRHNTRAFEPNFLLINAPPIHQESEKGEKIQFENR